MLWAARIILTVTRSYPNTAPRGTYISSPIHWSNNLAPPCRCLLWFILRIICSLATQRNVTFIRDIDLGRWMRAPPLFFPLYVGSKYDTRHPSAPHPFPCPSAHPSLLHSFLPSFLPLSLRSWQQSPLLFILIYVCCDRHPRHHHLLNMPPSGSLLFTILLVESTVRSPILIRVTLSNSATIAIATPPPTQQFYQL